MLEIKICEYYSEMPEDCIFDIEKEFDRIKLEVSADEKTLVKQIEGGNLISKDAFIDSFGYKLHISELSTGCKASLTVLHSDHWLNIRECGNNARDAIIKYCRNGKIVMCYNGVTISDYGFSGNIDVCVNGQYFAAVSHLNQYLEEL